MQIVNVPIEKLTPYAKNPRKNDKAVNAVAESIREFGFRVPCVIDKNGVLITGHTRVKACRVLGLKEVPCIVADDLSEDQVKAFRLADNKVAELADWDFDLLAEELADIELDMVDFGFEFEDYDTDYKHERAKENVEFQKANILNLETAQFEGVGKFGIPQIKPVYELPEIKEWISFNYVLSDNNPEGKAVHFFIDDYQFERVWNNPDAYLDRLRRYVCVASPDFSPYSDMPIALQIYNHYRKHWVARYWQENGITVIPTIRPTATETDLNWWLDGEPKESIIIVSSMWQKENIDEGNEADDEIERLLRPKKIFVYGKPSEEAVATNAEVEYISKFTEKWKNGTDES